MNEEAKEIDFREALRYSCVSMHLAADTKYEVIKEMIDMLADAGKICDRIEVESAVLKREKQMSTGMQCGVALLHGKTDTVDGLVTAIGLKKEGIDFGSLDGEPSRIFVMTVSRPDSTGPHVQFLGDISKLLNSEVLRERILAAENAVDLVGVLME